MARLHSYSDPSEDRPKKKLPAPKNLSWSPHRSLLPTGRCKHTEFLNLGTLPHSKIVQSARSGDICDTVHTAAKEGGVFDRK